MATKKTGTHGINYKIKKTFTGLWEIFAVLLYDVLTPESIKKCLFMWLVVIYFSGVIFVADSQEICHMCTFYQFFFTSFLNKKVHQTIDTISSRIPRE